LLFYRFIEGENDKCEGAMLLLQLDVFDGGAFVGSDFSQNNAQNETVRNSHKH